VPYDLSALNGVRNPHSLWQDYQECLAEVRAIVSGADKTAAAYSSACKNCVWYSACIVALEKANDLTLIFNLGRSKRDVMIDRIATLRDLAEINPEGFETGKGNKTVFSGIRAESLRKFQARALLAVTKDAKPYLTAPVTLPTSQRELFFDIEVDPMRDVCYLHGFVERNGGDIPGEKFHAFFSDERTPLARSKRSRRLGNSSRNGNLAPSTTIQNMNQRSIASSKRSILTLNVLLSFAQFEREVTAERIRDKVAASKQKGIWVGGPFRLAM
jgi:predicted RecB family nuclease